MWLLFFFFNFCDNMFLCLKIKNTARSQKPVDRDYRALKAYWWTSVWKFLFILFVQHLSKESHKVLYRISKKERNIQPYLHSDITKKSQGTLHVEQVQTALMMPVVPIESKHWGGIVSWQGSLSDPCQAHNQGWVVSRQNQRLGGHQNTPLCSTSYILL